MIDAGNAAIIIDGIPENEAEDIRRCLTTLYSVREGEQPLDREFGINQAFLDKPLNIASNMFALEVIEKTRQYEKRVSVQKVEYEFDELQGQMRPIIYLKGSENTS